MQLHLYRVGTPVSIPMSSPPSFHVAQVPCMIMEDDELEQAQKIRETFRKNPSYGSSWRAASEEFNENRRIFGSSKIGAAEGDAFPRAFRSYATRGASGNGNGASGATGASASTTTLNKDSAEPPGTLIASVRKTFYNSERANAPQARPPSPKSPQYSEPTK